MHFSEVMENAKQLEHQDTVFSLKQGIYTWLFHSKQDSFGGLTVPVATKQKVLTRLHENSLLVHHVHAPFYQL